MKKKLVSLMMAMVMATSAMVAVAAEEPKTPSVRVDDRAIYFADQAPVLLVEESRVLVPARGVFEAMDAEVKWDQNKKQVIVDSYNNIIRIVLTIDSKEMEVYTFTSLTSADKTVVELDAVAQLMNDRTMIPLRAISEALKADVAWDPETYLVDITSTQYQQFVADNTTADTPYDAKAVLPGLYITTDAETVKAGDTVTVNLCVENAALAGENMSYSGITATVFYDVEKIKFEKYTSVVNGEEVAPAAGGANAGFKQDSVKFSYVMDPMMTYTIEDPVISTLTFTALEDGPVTFALSDRITDLGDDTMIMFTDSEYEITSLQGADELYIDTTPLEVK